MKKSYIFQLEMMVRDYECDIQGIVNNANYLHFMEHTRHQFLLTEGVSFIDLHHRSSLFSGVLNDTVIRATTQSMPR